MKFLPCLPAFTTGFAEHRLLFRNQINAMRGPEPDKGPSNIRDAVWNDMAEMIVSTDNNSFDPISVTHELKTQIEQRAVDMQLLRRVDAEIRAMAKSTLGLTDRDLRMIVAGTPYLGHTLV